MIPSQKPLPLVIERLSFRYISRETPAIQDISFQLAPGEIMLLAGASGCGKTTLMRCINGLAPRTYRGDIEGAITVFGQDVQGLSMAQLSQQIGTVLQDPERQIVSSRVFNEVAFGLENLAIPRAEIRERVGETLAYLGISHLGERETFQLSGGEKQKIALAGVLAMRPRILLLDEPLASLDPASAHEALQLFRKLADDGISILLVEHRVEDALSIRPEKVMYLEDGHATYTGDVAGLLEIADPRMVKLPAEVTARRSAGRLAKKKDLIVERTPGRELLRFEDVSFRYGASERLALQDVSFTINSGEIIAILGPNGAGKSTLVKHALGLLKPTQGRVAVDGTSTSDLSVAQAAKTVGYVFQSPTQMLFATSVEKELEFGPTNLGQGKEEMAGNVDWALDSVHLSHEKQTPPLALSFGQQKRVSIAAIMAMRSRILIMDEPTAGQDYWNYTSFMDAILQMPGFDAIIFITHDLDLALIYANRILLVKDGAVAAQGTPEEVLSDYTTLINARVLPTSLLELNRRLLMQTGRFMRAEELAQFYPVNDQSFSGGDQ